MTIIRKKNLCFPHGLFTLMLLLLASIIPNNAIAQSHGDWCYARSAPYIDIVPRTDAIQYDFTKSEAELNSFKIDTVNPYGENVIVDVGGLMAGGIELKHSAKVGYVSNPNNGLACLWFDSLTVDIGISPTIYVAREYNKGTCMHNAILEHEMKHIEVDRQIVNKYANVIGYKLNDFLSQNSVYGPFPDSQIHTMQQQMTNQISDIIRNSTDIMKQDRAAAQQAIDSREEYDRVSGLCKDFKRKKLWKYKHRH